MLTFLPDTTGLQSSIVEVDYSSANVTCFFADGATGIGCHVSFGSLPGVNITRVMTSTIATASLPFPDVLMGQVRVIVAELLADGTVSSLTFEFMVNIPPSPSPTTSSPTTSSPSKRVFKVQWTFAYPALTSLTVDNKFYRFGQYSLGEST